MSVVNRQQREEEPSSSVGGKDYYYCRCCGVETHRICEIGRIKPLSNENVIHGSCRLCDNLLRKGFGSSALMIKSWPLETIQSHLNLYNNNSNAGETEDEEEKQSGQQQEEQETLFAKEINQLYRHEMDTDIVLRIGSKQIKAHKSIIMARCKGLAQIIHTKDISEVLKQYDDDENNNNIRVYDLSENSIASRIGTHDDSNILESVVELCYGIRISSIQQQNIWKKLGRDFVPSNTTLQKDLHNLRCNPRRYCPQTNILPTGNVIIIGRNFQTNTEEWIMSSPIHSSILCTHSQYVRAYLTHGWTIQTCADDEECSSSDGSVQKLLVLDSSQFTKVAIEELVEACYTNTMPSLDYSRWFAMNSTEQGRLESLQHFFQLYEGSSYLGMESISMLIAKNILSRYGMEYPHHIINFAEYVDSPYLIEKWNDFVCCEAEYLGDIKLSKLTFKQFQCILMSERLELPEEDILQLVISWWINNKNENHPNNDDTSASATATAATIATAAINDDDDNDQQHLVQICRPLCGDKVDDGDDDVQEVQDLLKYVRLPLIPIGSTAMRNAVHHGLVKRNDVEAYYRFQTEEQQQHWGHYRPYYNNDDVQATKAKATTITVQQRRRHEGEEATKFRLLRLNDCNRSHLENRLNQIQQSLTD